MAIGIGAAAFRRRGGIYLATNFRIRYVAVDVCGVIGRPPRREPSDSKESAPSYSPVQVLGPAFVAAGEAQQLSPRIW
jgi:hypothetical protein